MNYLKTAFKISPDDAVVNNCELLIEAGAESVSFLYYSKDDQRTEGLFIYHFEKNISPLSWAESLSAFLAKKELPNFTGCHIIYNFREFTLAPESMVSPGDEQAVIDCIFGKNGLANCHRQSIPNKQIVLLYRIPVEVEELFQQHFPQATIQHAVGLQMPVVGDKQATLYVVMYQASFKIMLFKEGQLQLVQFADFNTPADVAYHLMNACEQHQLLPVETTLTLSGFVDKKSNLYDELYRYFGDIQMDDKLLVKQSEALDHYPAHFFSHLNMLVQCVL